MARIAAVSSPPPCPPFHLGFAGQLPPVDQGGKSAHILQLQAHVQQGVVVAAMAVEEDEFSDAITI